MKNFALGQANFFAKIRGKYYRILIFLSFSSLILIGLDACGNPNLAQNSLSIQSASSFSGLAPNVNLISLLNLDNNGLIPAQITTHPMLWANSAGTTIGPGAGYQISIGSGNLSEFYQILLYAQAFVVSADFATSQIFDYLSFKRNNAKLSQSEFNINRDGSFNLDITTSINSEIYVVFYFVDMISALGHLKKNLSSTEYNQLLLSISKNKDAISLIKSRLSKDYIPAFIGKSSTLKISSSRILSKNIAIQIWQNQQYFEAGNADISNPVIYWGDDNVNNLLIPLGIQSSTTESYSFSFLDHTALSELNAGKSQNIVIFKKTPTGKFIWPYSIMKLDKIKTRYQKLDAFGAPLKIQNLTWNKTGTSSEFNKWQCVKDKQSGNIYNINWENKSGTKSAEGFALATNFNDFNITQNFKACSINNWQVLQATEYSNIIKNRTQNSASFFFPLLENYSNLAVQSFFAKSGNPSSSRFFVNQIDSAGVVSQASSSTPAYIMSVGRIK